MCNLLFSRTHYFFSFFSAIKNSYTKYELFFCKIEIWRSFLKLEIKFVVTPRGIDTQHKLLKDILLVLFYLVRVVQ